MPDIEARGCFLAQNRPLSLGEGVRAFADEFPRAGADIGHDDFNL